jgi:MFS family permease
MTLALGLRANWRQFALLVVVNAFVGAMVGLERVVLPLVATKDFALASTTAALAFIATFGLAKSLSNLAAGWLVDHRGRRFTLVLGWLIALPVPVLILAAPSWWWIVAANALLGVNQGLAWSATVIMKIDLVGPTRRGLAMGLNEFAGYIAVALAALASGFWSARSASPGDLRAAPGYLGIGVAVIGLLLSVVFVRDTVAHAELEKRLQTDRLSLRPERSALRRSLWSDRALSSLSHTGMVNNLNDGLAWGLFPLLFSAAALSLRQLSILVAIYPATWGICQLWTGALSDRWGRKWLIVAGMLLQGAALTIIAMTHDVTAWIGALLALGVGTALVYPTLLAAVADISHPAERGAAVGVYRLWRDAGYAVGALAAGAMADAFGAASAIGIIGALTTAAGFMVAIRFTEVPTRERGRKRSYAALAH